MSSVKNDKTVVWKVVMQLMTLFTIGGLVMLLHVLQGMSQSIKPCVPTAEQRATAALIAAQAEKERAGKALREADAALKKLRKDGGL